MIGKAVIDNQDSGCLCQPGWTEDDKPFKYGILCDSNVPINQDGDECIHGVHNPKNTITGCACTDEHGSPTAYHGWYCDVPNWKLCAPIEKYYVHERASTVGDNGKACASCVSATNYYCEKCIQKNEKGLVIRLTCYN